jgi:hypothetical protein
LRELLLDLMLLMLLHELLLLLSHLCGLSAVARLHGHLRLLLTPIVLLTPMVLLASLVLLASREWLLLLLLLRFGAVSQMPKCGEVYFGEGEERGQEERGWSRCLSHPVPQRGNFGRILLPASSKHGTVVRPHGHENTP